MEREGIDRRVDEATRSGDQRRQELVEDVAEERRRQLEEMPPDLAGRVQAMQNYEFMDDAARERFEELMDQLREQLMQSYFNQLSEGMQNMTPERMAQMKDMLNELNQMLEQRERGEEPDFDGFMERHGEFFPGNPQNLDELLEQMAQSMAQMQQLMNSMSPEQRGAATGSRRVVAGRHGPPLAGRPAVAQPAAGVPEPAVAAVAELQRRRPVAVRPDAGLARHARRPRRPREPLAVGHATGRARRGRPRPARELLGDDAAKSLDRLRELSEMLEDAGLIEQREGRLELTPRRASAPSAARRSPTSTASC